jgi:hypothetical protein
METGHPVAEGWLTLRVIHSCWLVNNVGEAAQITGRRNKSGPSRLKKSARAMTSGSWSKYNNKD